MLQQAIIHIISWIAIHPGNQGATILVILLIGWAVGLVLRSDIQ